MKDRSDSPIRGATDAWTRLYLPVVCAGILLAAGLLVHYRALAAPFLFDDFVYFVDDARIRTLAWPWAFLRGSTRPVLFLSLALNHAAGGLDPFGYHLANVLIVAASGLVLFGIVRRTLARLGPAADRGAGETTPAVEPGRAHARVGIALAFVCALLWIAHPIQTNVTAYVWQRSEALMGLFYLLTLYSFIRGAEGGSRTWFATAVLFCMLGMGAKEVMVTAPLAVLLYDRAFVGGSFRAAVRQRWSVHAGLAATWGLLGALLAGHAASFHVNPGLGFRSNLISPLAYAATMPGVLAHYLRLAIWPEGLCFDTNWPLAETPADILVPLLLIGPALAGTLYGLWRNRAWAYPAVWFFLVLAPTSSIMPMPRAVWEYRLHLPLAGVLVLVVSIVVFAAWRLAGGFGASPGGRRRAGRWALGVLVGVAVVFGALMHARCGDFQSAERLWRDTFGKRPDNLRAFTQLWEALENNGRIDEAGRTYAALVRRDPDRLDARLLLGRVAIEHEAWEEGRRHLLHALSVAPDFFLAHYYLGRIAEAEERFDEALDRYRAAVRLRPLFAKGRTAIGGVFEKRGQFAQALDAYDEAVRLWPGWWEAQTCRGRALMRLDRPREALAAFLRAVEAEPRQAVCHAGVGEALLALSDFAGARAAFGWALRMDPDNAGWHHDLGRVFLAEGRPRLAASAFRAALARDPDLAAAHTRLGVLRAEEGRLDAAVRHFEQALRTDPNPGRAHFNLALTYERQGKRDAAIEHYEAAAALLPDDARVRARLEALRAMEE